MERKDDAAARNRRRTLVRYIQASLAMIGGFAGLAVALAFITR